MYKRLFGMYVFAAGWIQRLECHEFTRPFSMAMAVS
jgi:hypothetical protein